LFGDLGGVLLGDGAGLVEVVAPQLGGDVRGPEEVERAGDARLALCRWLVWVIYHGGYVPSGRYV